MSIVAAPSNNFEATVSGMPTGITGTIGVRIVDNAGGTVTARSTAGVTEHPAGSGLYSKTMLSPSVPGQYSVVWDTGGSDVSWAVEDLTVTPVSAPPLYVPDGTARATMADLIARVRAMIDDETAPTVFTDREVQEALDSRSDEARYYPLQEKESIAPGGVVTYLTFDAPVGAWETGAQLVNSSYSVLTPATADLWIGRWTFATEPSYPVMVTGTTYDLYGAAGDLLLQWATKETCAFDVSADGLSLSRSQKSAMKAEQARSYHAKARTMTTNLVRTDEA